MLDRVPRLVSVTLAVGCVTAGGVCPPAAAAEGKPVSRSTQARAVAVRPATNTPARKPAAKPASRTGVKPAAQAGSKASDTPEAVVRAFLQAQKERDDKKVYSQLSAAMRKSKTQKEWEDQAHQVRSTFSAIPLVAGEVLMIGGGPAIPATIGKVTVKGDSATVEVSRMLPVKNTLHLVRENGRWTVDLQRSLLGNENPTDAAKPPAPPTGTTVTPAAPTNPTTPAPPADYSAQCRSNLRQIATAFQLYALDHEGRLPDAAKWVDEITPYLANPSLLRCPPDSTAEASFAMNAALSGQKLSGISGQGERVLLYETTTTSKNQSGAGETLPAKAPNATGYVLLMADGSVTQRAGKPEVK